MGHSKLGNQPSPPDRPPSAPPQQAPPETWIMGAPSAPPAITGNGQADTYVSVEHVQSPFASSTGGPANACASHPVINTSSDPVPNQGNAISNPYVNISSVPSKSPKETIINVLGRCGKKLEDTTKKAGDAAVKFLAPPKFLQKAVMAWFSSKNLLFRQEKSFEKHMLHISPLQQVP